MSRGAESGCATPSVTEGRECIPTLVGCFRVLLIVFSCFALMRNSVKYCRCVMHMPGRGYQRGMGRGYQILPPHDCPPQLIRHLGVGA